MTTNRTLFILALVLGLAAVTAASASPPAATDSSSEPAAVASTPAPADQAAPDSDTVAQPTVMSRIERWAGSYNGCMNGATPEERAMAASLEYTCACLATYIVNLCAPTDATTNDQVMACFGVNEMQVQNAFNRCLTYGALVVSP